MKEFLFLIVFTFTFLISNAQQYELDSPDGKLIAEIEIKEGISAKLLKDNNAAVLLKNIWLETENKGQIFSDFKVKKTIRNSVNETIIPVIKEKEAVLTNAYNEIEILFKSGSSIIFRLFNEGLAYRLSTSVKDSLIISNENLNLQFKANDSVRFQASRSFNSSYETPYEHKSINGIEKDGLCHLPLLVEKQNGLFVLVTESDLYNYPGLWLKGTGQPKFSATFPPYPKKLRYTGSIYGHGQITETENYIAKVAGTRNYPWRIFAVASTEKELIANNMVFLLATPNVLDDVSWIKPGVVMFDWWAKNNIYGVDFKAGINT
ncbi:MAG TPA: glycoside hydrolase family 97 N-terminal domain-containing protein, partial [Draconibacterium sp.]|nr:glycoside hydrolase family 97 N-terminal domain-containing protein [Draconibacterium sp.]